MKAGTKAALSRESIHLVRRDGTVHIVSEDYSYKTESYYSILSHEMEGIPVAPASSDALDAYVVPLCLERAGMAGIPVADCVISHSCAEYPSILYGLNYFASSAEFSRVCDENTGKATIRHITNNGKYPFCFQKLGNDSPVENHIAIFGRSLSTDKEIRKHAESLYELFRLPLMTMIFIRSEKGLLLSSIAPTRYSHMSNAEKSLLMAYISNQEFL